MSQTLTATDTRTKKAGRKPAGPPGVFSILGPYRRQIAVLIALAMLANGFTLQIPRLVQQGIDTYIDGSYDATALILRFCIYAGIILLFTALQSVAQTFVSEKVAFDVRQSLADKLSRQGFAFIEEKNPAKLLTNLTSDIDAIKMFVAQVIVSLVTSAVIIIGTAIILLRIDWQLALVVLMVIPLIGGTFYTILGRVRPYFAQAREVIDALNKVIRESIIGAALIRLLDATAVEQLRFDGVNQRGRDIGFRIVRMFSFMIPVITFVAGMGTLSVVTLGGHFVIQGEMTLGSFAAFLNYLTMLIFPILVIGFMSNIIAQATASWARIRVVLQAPDAGKAGTGTITLQGDIRVRNLSLEHAGKPVLREVSLHIGPGSRTAILGPTAAGKTQLLNILAGLAPVPAGQVEYDGQPLSALDPDSFYPQVGLVFQDSVLFNATLRENIAFSPQATDADLALAVQTAELQGFIATLPQGLDTEVSERGTTLSGGQKQRVMLARALALRPSILFLDDFTARVDTRTEQKILENIRSNYPQLTLVSITQKIAPVMDYDQIVLLMEGEIIASGTHAALMESCPEYVQIFNSQQSTSSYDVRPQA
jgi:ATP-binding cassette subfamily B protein